MADVFISHASEDGALATQIARALEAEGYTTWYYQRANLPGVDYLGAVVDAIDQCTAFVLLASDASLSSQEVDKEVIGAHQKGKHFVPLLRGIAHEDLKQRRPRWQHCIGTSVVEAISEADVGRIIPRLVEGLRLQGILSGEGSPRSCRVFDENGRLNTKVFGFAIDQVLFRAAKRRSLQDRAFVSVEDMIAGMVRKGDLTRYALRRTGVDPDKLYGACLRRREPGPGRGSPAGGRRGDERRPEGGRGADEPRGETLKGIVRKLLAGHTVRDHAEFHPGLVRMLINADNADRPVRDATPPERAGRSPRAEAGIAEEAVLRCLLAETAWRDLRPEGFPPAAEVLRVVDDRVRSGEVDANGALVLVCLAPEAYRVVETAHALAQERGICPITQRITLAAFVHDGTSYASRACRAAGLDPGFLFKGMMAVSKEDRPRSFGLNPETCGRVLLPVIREARRIAADASAVNEKELFRAFCAKAASKFKAILRELPVKVDLDELAWRSLPASSAEPSACSGGPVNRTDVPAHPRTACDVEGLSRSRFDDHAWRIITRSVGLARRRGRGGVRTPHLFAAMVGDGSGPVGAALRRQQADPLVVARHALSLVPESRGPGSPSGEDGPASFSGNAKTVIGKATDLASSRKRARATGDDLLDALFADGGGVIGRLFERLGLQPLGAPGSPPSPDAPSRARGTETDPRSDTENG